MNFWVKRALDGISLSAPKLLTDVENYSVADGTQWISTQHTKNILDVL